MKQQQSSINLIMKGYDTYAVLKGGKNVIKFSDNSDIATDKNPTPIEVAPKGEKNPIKWIPRGRNNHMPYDIMKKIGTNVTIGSNIEFKNKVVFGDSILVYRKYRDPKTRKIVKEEVLPYEQPEIFEFLENKTSILSVWSWQTIWLYSMTATWSIYSTMTINPPNSYKSKLRSPLVPGSVKLTKRLVKANGTVILQNGIPVHQQI